MRKILAAAAGAVVIFGVGVAVGESLHDNPKPGGTITQTTTLRTP